MDQGWVYLLQFPASALFGVSFILLVYILYRQFHDTRIVRMLSGWKAASVLLVLIALTIAVEGTSGYKFHSTVPFFVEALVFQACLEFTVAEHWRNKRKLTLSSAAFLLAHAGMFLLVWAAFFGAPDHVEGNISASFKSVVKTAYSADGKSVPLPFSITLEKFEVDTYPDGVCPRQYTSRLAICDLLDGSVHHLETSVNHPCAYKGYKIYQEGFDKDARSYTVLKVVRDPWLPTVYFGMMLLAIGSAISLAGRFRLKVFVPALAVLAVIFTAVSIARINFGTLQPALRSLWFVPHLLVYMVAYSAMAIAVVLALVALTHVKNAGSLREFSEKMLRISSVLLIFGMLFGCVWAKSAWGDYWTWDPKECWAAVTWLLTQLYLHLLPGRRKTAFWMLPVLVSSFLALQITWYGINFLPSAKESMHTYNK